MSSSQVSRAGWLVLLSVVLSFVGGWKIGRDYDSNGSTIVSDTVVLERWDTVEISVPTEIVRHVVKYDTISIAEMVVVPDSGGSAVVLPIEQSVYSDSTEKTAYTAYVSGYNAVLDSISIDCRNTETIITNIVEKQPRRIGAGIQVGVGVSAKGVAVPYLGIGLQYRIW